MLADGEFRSGEAMARVLGVSRASVWNALHALDASGLEIFRVRGRGYRLAEPLAMLDRGAIEDALKAHAQQFAIEVIDTVESTNTLLMQRAENGAPSATVIAAEWQTQGRGRRGRPWHALPGATLTFSLLWRFQQGAGFLAGLSLAVGVALTRVLAACGVRDVGLKWPNDMLWHGCKLAGILIEMHGDMLGPSSAVIGIGLNCRLPPALRERIDQPVADVVAAGSTVANRNRLLALLLIELESVLTRFAREGFAPFRDEWQRWHVYQGKPVKLALPDGGTVYGTAEGIAENGALLLATRTGQLHVHSGELTLRAGGESSVR